MRGPLVVIVTPGQEGLRLDQVLGATEELSRTMARRLIGQGAVWLDGRRIKVFGRRVRAGQRIEVYLEETSNPKGSGKTTAVTRTPAVKVLYRDERFVAIDKPPGMPSAPTPRRQDGVATSETAGALGLDHAPQPLHRLDRDTSGVMVMALSQDAAKLVSSLQQEGVIERRYLALSLGRPEQDEGLWDAPLARDPGRPGRWRVWDRGRAARTGYSVLGPSRFEGLWLLELTLQTGRTHQIRLHMSHAGCPVVGDPWYGAAGSIVSPSAGTWARSLDGRPRMFLHSKLWGLRDDRLTLRIESVPDWLEPVFSG